jgi:hypothetical protein
MNKAQLPLMAELSLADTEELTQKKSTKVFTGTDNPRHLRVIHSLKSRPQPREQIDRVAGCSNAPDLIANLRRKGLDIPCKKAPVIDCDGVVVFRGIYSLSKDDNSKINKWQSNKSTRNPHALYEERKKQWDQQNPNATPEQRDVAIRRIAKECGV